MWLFLRAPFGPTCLTLPCFRLRRPAAHLRPSHQLFFAVPLGSRQPSKPSPFLPLRRRRPGSASPASQLAECDRVWVLDSIILHDVKYVFKRKLCGRFVSLCPNKKGDSLIGRKGSTRAQVTGSALPRVSGWSGSVRFGQVPTRFCQGCAGRRCQGGDSFMGVGAYGASGGQTSAPSVSSWDYRLGSRMRDWCHIAHSVLVESKS